MTDQIVTEDGPDPSWTVSELLDRAEACETLSAAWLAPLAALDPAALPPYEQLALSLVLHRMVAVAEALSLTALAAVPDRRCKPDPALQNTNPEASARMCKGGNVCLHRWQIEELAALTGASLWGMRRKWGWSRELTGPWADLLPLLAGGQISTEHLRRFEHATSGASDHAIAAAVHAVLTLAQSATRRRTTVAVNTLARLVRKTVALHTTPEEALDQHREAALEQTGTAFTDLGSGLAAFTLTGDTVGMEALRALVHDHPAVTHPAPGETRTRGQLEVDLILSLCLHPTSSAPEAPAGSRAAATPDVGVIITASLETLLGLSNTPAMIGDTLIDAELARHWAADPAWARRAIHDHNGAITTTSNKQRFPNRRLRRTAHHRWQHCTFPGCTRRATEIPLDHADPYWAGGQTLLTNLHPLCPRHHLFKEQPGVHVTLNPDGTATWTLPSGRTVTVTAPDHRTQHTGCCSSATLTANHPAETSEYDPNGPPEHHDDPAYWLRVHRAIRQDATREPQPFPDRQPPPDTGPPHDFDWDTWAADLIARDPANSTIG